MKQGRAMIVSTLALLLAVGIAAAASAAELHRSFSGITAVEISTTSGDCVVRTHGSGEVLVDVVYDVEPEGALELEFDESGKRLVIKESWQSKIRRPVRSDVKWTLTVPADIEIEFSTASGDFTASGLTGRVDAGTASGDIHLRDMNCDVDISTASGDITLVNIQGDMDLSTASGGITVENAGGGVELSTASGDITVENAGGGVDLSTASGDITAAGLSGVVDLSAASGDIEISGSKGAFDINCASGDITAKDLVIAGESEFSAASGDIEITLAETSGFDLDLISASGDILLDYSGNEVSGFFEFTAHKRRGRIVCPFGFDSEEEYEQGGETNLRKSFSKGGDTPRIELTTASGTAELKK